MEESCPIRHSLTFPSALNAAALPVGRAIGQVQCGACDWTAAMTGDTLQEIEQFLTTRLLAHVIEHHDPEKRSP